MAKDLTVMLEDRPGTLAAFGEAMGRAGVDMLGGCGADTPAEREQFHFAVEDVAAARSAAEAAGYRITGEREVLLLDVAHRAGGLGAALKPLADAGINIELVYMSQDGRLVVGTSDPERARSVGGG